MYKISPLLYRECHDHVFQCRLDIKKNKVVRNKTIHTLNYEHLSSMKCGTNQVADSNLKQIMISLNCSRIPYVKLAPKLLHQNIKNNPCHKIAILWLSPGGASRSSTHNYVCTMCLKFQKNDSATQCRYLRHHQVILAYHDFDFQMLYAVTFQSWYSALNDPHIF